MANLHSKTSFGEVVDQCAEFQYGLCLIYAIVSSVFI